MAIGTSLGAYFESPFHQEAGIVTPPDTGDDNVLPPDSETQTNPPDKSAAIKITPVRYDQNFNTVLTPEEEPDFQKWKEKNAPNDTGEDYDLRGAYKEGLSRDTPEEHLPDTYKKPNHPTFSDQSKYAKDAPDLAGSWDGDRYIPNINAVKPLDAIDKLLGVNGAERYQLWPERMVRDALSTVHSVASGSIPMWNYDPDSGEMHTSMEGMEAAKDLMPFAVGGPRTGTIPTTVHLQGPGADAINEGPSAFQQFMSTRGARQPSNITQPLEGEVLPPLAGRPVDHPDFTQAVNEYHDALVEHSQNQGNEAWQPRGIRSGESLRDFAEREVDRADPNLRYRGHAPEEDIFHQEPFNPHYPSVDWETNLNQSIEENETRGRSYGSAAAREIQNNFRDNPDKVTTNRGVSLMYSPSQQFATPNTHMFHFMNEAGNVGELNVREQQGGKRLYVPWMGSVGTAGPHDIGGAEVRGLIGILKDKFPDAESISGFRVSGARAASGRIGDAEMRLRPRSQAAE